MYKRQHARIDHLSASLQTPHDHKYKSPQEDLQITTCQTQESTRVCNATLPSLPCAADTRSSVGIVFAAILATAFTIGVSATIYYAWVQPAFARYRLRKRLREQQSPKGQDNVSSPVSPDTNYHLNTPNFGSPTKDLEKGDTIFVKETVVVDNVLTPPKPTFSFAKTDRFSTSTRDGVWWFV